eukprot:GHVT01064597.1.p1 GENE.GHVT01064597.1~~GHVT01064597.1.p1  ORF type:complete len:136 (+),score=14.72 GHVT01064597.1:102-509(+)
MSAPWPTGVEQKPPRALQPAGQVCEPWWAPDQTGESPGEVWHGLVLPDVLPGRTAAFRKDLEDFLSALCKEAQQEERETNQASQTSSWTEHHARMSEEIPSSDREIHSHPSACKLSNAPTCFASRHELTVSSGGL